jgi:hypothetical protein
MSRDWKSPQNYRSAPSPVTAEPFEIVGTVGLIAEAPADPAVFPVTVTVGGNARTRVTGTPSAGQYRIQTQIVMGADGAPHTEWLPILEFHSSDAGLSGTATYYRTGTVLTDAFFDLLRWFLTPLTGLASESALAAAYPATTDVTKRGRPGEIAFIADGSAFYSDGSSWVRISANTTPTSAVSEYLAAAALGVAQTSGFSAAWSNAASFAAALGFSSVSDYVSNGVLGALAMTQTMGVSATSSFSASWSDGGSPGAALGVSFASGYTGPAGPLALKAMQFALGAGTGTQDVTWAADSAWPDTTQPKLIMSMGGRITANGSAVQGFSQSLGFMTGTAALAGWWGNQDNVAATVVRSRLRAAGLSLYTPGATPTADGEFSLSSMLSNGFRISRDAAAGASYLVTSLALGGSELQVAMGDALTPTSTGTQTYNTGFQPTAVIVMAVLDDNAATDAASASTHIRRSIGFASGTATAAQCAVPTMQRDGVSSDSGAGSARWGQTGRVVSVIDYDGATGSELVKGVLSAWNGSGFTIDWQTVSATARRLVWVALGGISAKAGYVTTANPAGDVAVTGLGFAPKAGIFAATRPAEGAPVAGSDTLSLALAGPGLTQYAMGQIVTPLPSVTDHGQIQTASRIYTNLARSAQDTFALNRQTGLKSWDADGFTVTTYENDGVPLFYLALG